MNKFVKWITLLLMLSIFLLSCRPKSEISSQNQDLIIAKTVPSDYYSAKDSLFQVHNDTVYYDQHLFTGYRYSLYENRDTAFVSSYFNGVEEGLQKKWWPNGQLEEIRFYINGKKEGLHQGWWANGKNRFQFTANHDEYEGTFKEWSNNGLMIKCFHYQNGNEEGSQRLWWGDGSVRANYVIKNGKKYGFMGYQVCQNPYDSVLKK